MWAFRVILVSDQLVCILQCAIEFPELHRGIRKLTAVSSKFPLMNCLFLMIYKKIHFFTSFLDEKKPKRLFGLLQRFLFGFVFSTIV